MPSDDRALQLVSRSISIRCVIEYWANATTYDQFHSEMYKHINSNLESVNFQPLIEQSFRITVETYNKHIQHKEKVAKIETLSYLPFKGDVNLKKPDFECYYIEFYGLDPNNVPEQPNQILFGKWVRKYTLNTSKCKFNLRIN